MHLWTNWVNLFKISHSSYQISKNSFHISFHKSVCISYCITLNVFWDHFHWTDNTHSMYVCMNSSFSKRIIFHSNIPFHIKLHSKCCILMPHFNLQWIIIKWNKRKIQQTKTVDNEVTIFTLLLYHLFKDRRPNVLFYLKHIFNSCFCCFDCVLTLSDNIEFEFFS